MHSEHLCLSCGMCCNGAMYGHIVLTPDDAGTLAEVGAVPQREGSALPQPCTFLDGRRCTIYARRFRSCRAFECATLRAAKAGEIPPEEATRRVGLADDALIAVRAVLDPGEDLPEARARRQRALAQGEVSAADARLAMLLTALDRVLDRYFRYPGDRVIDRQF